MPVTAAGVRAGLVEEKAGGGGNGRHTQHFGDGNAEDNCGAHGCGCVVLYVQYRVEMVEVDRDVVNGRMNWVTVDKSWWLAFCGEI